jgi:radical SAM protein with 4Fe4S-binding SPASM domain
MFVSHTGEVQPSGFLPLSAGNVRSATVADIYRNSELFQQLRNTNNLHGKCGDCEFREVCGGSRARAYALNDDAFGADPSCAYVPRTTKAKQRALRCTNDRSCPYQKEEGPEGRCG